MTDSSNNDIQQILDNVVNQQDKEKVFVEEKEKFVSEVIDKVCGLYDQHENIFDVLGEYNKFDFKGRGEDNEIELKQLKESIEDTVNRLADNLEDFENAKNSRISFDTDFSLVSSGPNYSTHNTGSVGFTLENNTISNIERYFWRLGDLKTLELSDINNNPKVSVSYNKDEYSDLAKITKEFDTEYKMHSVKHPYENKFSCFENTTDDGVKNIVIEKTEDSTSLKEHCAHQSVFCDEEGKPVASVILTADTKDFPDEYDKDVILKVLAEKAKIDLPGNIAKLQNGELEKLTVQNIAGTKENIDKNPEGSTIDVKDHSGATEKLTSSDKEMKIS